jgi:hypothetical protein
MAAGLGFKDFTTGEVLTAADVDGYLMQGVWVFASAAARDAAVTSPQEGNFAYLKDTNVTTYYTGSAWANLDTTGMTNPMTTTGDTIYSSSGSTPARLGIGSTGQVLTVAGGVPTWASPAGGGKILQVVSTNDNTKKQVSNATEYTEIATAITPSSASSRILIMVSFGLVSNSTNADSAFRIKRDSTAIQQGTGGTVNINQSFFMAEGSSEGSGYTIQVVDSPATTSAITYKVELLANTGTININRRGLDTYYAASSSMTLMEIGA